MEQTKKTPTKKEKTEHLMNEIGISVSFTSFAAAIDFVFVGLLLTGDENVQMRLRIPIILLFLSAFGFIFATLIFANASGKIARSKNKVVRNYIETGNITSEYFGVYGLIFAVPLVILGYSPDKILSVIILVIAILGFSIYQFMHFSILSRLFNGTKFYFIVLTILALLTTSFILFYLNFNLLYQIIAILLVIVLFFLYFISLRINEE